VGGPGRKRKAHVVDAQAQEQLKIIASAVVQTDVDIDAVEKSRVDGIGMDYLIKRKFLTWGENTTLDGSRSSDGPLISTPTKCPVRGRDARGILSQ
jgi:hypothetical protein